jgi:hypothetical protein
MLLALVAYRTFWRRQRAEALLYLSIVAIYLVVYSTYGFWDGGWAWGSRFLVATIPYWIIPLGYLVGDSCHRVSVVLMSCLGIGVQILGVMITYD